MPKRKFDETANVPMQLSEQSRSLCKSILSEDGALKYDFMISLQKIAIIKIATCLFMNGITAQQYFELRSSVKCMDFIINKISELQLPSTFTRILKNALQSAAESVKNWIIYHDEYIFYDLSRNSTYSFINKIKWNSRGRIDYGETARNILASRDNCLNDEHKYRLACTYCLEEEIVILASNVVHEGYLDGVDDTKYPMVHFWTAHITGDTRKFCITSFFTDQVYLRCLNEVSIRYIWNRLSAEEKSNCKYISLTNDRDFWRFKDFQFSVLSSLNYELQQDVFRERSRGILESMMNDWLWKDYFLPTAIHVLNIMKSIDYAYILSSILSEIRGCQAKNSSGRILLKISEKGLCDQYKSMFKLLWREAPMHMKEFAFCRLKNNLSENSNWIPVDLYETILKDFNAEQKKNFIFSDTRFWAKILQAGGFEMADYLIKCCEASPAEINDLKNELMLSINTHYFKSFFYSKKTDVSLVIKWCNPSKETVAN